MKKPEIEIACGWFEESDQLTVNGEAIDLEEIKERYDSMVGALISVNNDLDKGDDWNGEIRVKTIYDLHEALKKAGVEL